MTRDFSDETKEELLKNIDEEYNTSVFNGPPMGEGNLAEDLYNLINTPWLTLFALDGALTAKNIAAKREIEAIWEEVYKVAGTYDTKIQHLYSLAEALKKKIEYITVTLTPTGTGDTGYAVIDSLPEEFQAGFTVVNNAVNNAKNTMTEYLLEEMVIRNDNGEIVDYNYDVISELMDKNADDITSVEYKALAYAFIGDGSISDDAHDKHIEVQNLIINGCYDLQKETEFNDITNRTQVLQYYSQNDKFSNLYNIIINMESEYYETINTLETEERKEVVGSGFWDYLEQNKLIFQFLDTSTDLVVPSMYDYNGNLYGEKRTPVMLYCEDEEGTVRINFVEAEYAMEGTFELNPAAEQYVTYRNNFQETYIISPLVFADEVEKFYYYETEKLNVALCGDGNISFSEILIGNFVSKEQKKVYKELLEKYMSKTKAGIVMMLVQSGCKYKEAEKKYEENKALFDEFYLKCNQLEMVDNYNLGAVQVEHIVGDGSEGEVQYLFIEGLGGENLTINPTTQMIVDNVNYNLTSHPELYIAVEDVLNGSDLVYECENVITEIAYDEEGITPLDFYGEAFYVGE